MDAIDMDAVQLTPPPSCSRDRRSSYSIDDVAYATGRLRASSTQEV